MFFGLGVLNVDLGGLVAAIVAITLAIIGGVVWLVRLEGSAKSTQKGLMNTNKSVDNMKCEVDTLKESVRDIDLKCKLTHKDVGFIKETLDGINKKIEDQNKLHEEGNKQVIKQIIELLAK